MRPPDHDDTAWYWWNQGAEAEMTARKKPLRFLQLENLFDALTERYADNMDVPDYVIVLKLAQIMCPSKLKRKWRIRG